MARSQLRFKERDLRRALRAASKEGVSARIEIDRDGKIVIIPGACREDERAGENEWDAA